MARRTTTACSGARQVTAKDDRGYIVETLCVAHACEVITARVESLKKFVYDTTGAPVVRITIEFLRP
jgi:hypothetical protein